MLRTKKARLPRVHSGLFQMFRLDKQRGLNQKTDQPETSGIHDHFSDAGDMGAVYRFTHGRGLPQK